MQVKLQRNLRSRPVRLMHNRHPAISPTGYKSGTMRALATKLRDTGKARAFAIHLGLSSTAVGVLAALMFTRWYPPPYFLFDGGWQVLRLILLVDVVLGPLLTLIVFDRAKKELRRDLTIIALLQCVALGYGAWVMHAYRPAFIVYAEKTFHSVNWREIEHASDSLVVPRALAATGAAPVPVFARFPAQKSERDRLFKAMSEGGPAVMHYGQYYARLDTAVFDTIVREAASIDDLAHGDTDIAAELKRVRAAHAGKSLAFIPLGCRYALIMLVFDRSTREIVDSMK